MRSRLLASALALACAACPAEPNPPDQSAVPVATSYALSPSQGNRASDAPSPETPEAIDPLDPGPPIRIAGSRGLDVYSRLFFKAIPDRAHQLRTTYGYPERARWSLGLEKATNAASRRLEYRFGGRAWTLAEGDLTSTRLDDEQTRALVRRVELRRAVLLWPEGFAWEPPGDGASQMRAQLGRGAGELVATLDSDGLPLEMGSIDSAGAPVDTYRIEAREEGPRRTPSRLTLLVDGRPIWTETLEQYETRAYFQDDFYQPVDRREDD